MVPRRCVSLRALGVAHVRRVRTAQAPAARLRARPARAHRGQLAAGTHPAPHTVIHTLFFFISIHKWRVRSNIGMLYKCCVTMIGKLPTLCTIAYFLCDFDLYLHHQSSQTSSKLN